MKAAVVGLHLIGKAFRPEFEALAAPERVPDRGSGSRTGTVLCPYRILRRIASYLEAAGTDWAVEFSLYYEPIVDIELYNSYSAEAE
jgi:hypothetical protein